MANVLVLGATGYIGSRLVPRLLRAGHAVRCLVRNPDRLTSSVREKVQFSVGDILDPDSLAPAFEDIDIVYYLVHSMTAGEKEFEERDRRAAANVALASEKAGAKRIIYLGGLGKRGKVQSPHLRSRHETGDLLRKGSVPTTEFRAAVIVGSGSASFEMVHHLVNRLPLMICPRWLIVRTQPIAVSDVLEYLVQAPETPASTGRIIDIGGPEVLTYRSMMLTVARVLGLKRLLIQVPVLTPRLSSYWVNLVTPISAHLARSLIESVRQETICENRDALDLFPIKPLRYEDAVRRALALVLTKMGLPEESEETDLDPTHLLTDRQEIRVKTSAQKLFETISAIGGTNGWYAVNWLWQLRGWIDSLLGGVGLRRMRRDPRHLIEGDVLDFWRVENVIPDKELRLRAEMKVWGQAWLEFHVLPSGESTSVLVQTAHYYPKGIGGLLYWFSIFPLHLFVFKALARGIRRKAENPTP